MSAHSEPGAGRNLLAARIIIALLNVLIVIGSRLGGGFHELADFLAVGIPLVPTLIYVVGARTDLAVMRYGLTILALSAFVWLPFAVTGEPMWLITLFPATLVALAISILAVVNKPTVELQDPTRFRRPWWNPTG